MSVRIVENMVGSHSTSEKDIRCARALRAIERGSALICQELGLQEGEALAVMAAAAAATADRIGARTELAEVFERWAVLLRTDQPVVYEAQGNA